MWSLVWVQIMRIKGHICLKMISFIRDTCWKRCSFSGRFRPHLELLGHYGHVHVPTFDSISHALGLKLSFWSNFQMILHGFASRSPRTRFFHQTMLYIYIYCSLMEKYVLSSSMQKHAESSGNYFKNLVLDPKRAKLNQNSDFGHVRTYRWLNKLRTIQRKIYGKYLGHIYIYIYIYRERERDMYKWHIYIRNI